MERHSDSLLYRMIFHMGRPSDCLLYGILYVKTIGGCSIWEGHPMVFYVERQSDGPLYGKPIWWSSIWEDHPMVFNIWEDHPMVFHTWEGHPMVFHIWEGHPMVFYMGRPSEGLPYWKTIEGSSMWEYNLMASYLVLYMGKPIRGSSIWDDHPMAFYMERPPNNLLYGKTIR